MSSPIDNPLTISFAGMPVAPLRFFLQRDYAPAGAVHEVDEGVTATFMPAYVEWGLQLTGADATAVLYQFPRTDDTDVICACLNEAVTPLFKVLTGADYGEALTTLVAEQWPDFHRLLADSTADVPGTRKLWRVITTEVTQWIVADELTGADRRVLAGATATSLIGTALETFHKATHPADLKNIIEVFAAPNRRTRRLNAIKGLVEAVPAIVGQIQGGLSSLNVAELIEVAGECLEHVQELRR